MLQNRIPKWVKHRKKIVSAGCLGRSLLSSAKTCRTVYPLKPCWEGSRLHESTVFICSLSPQQVSKMVAKSYRNGGPKLSKRSPERVSKKCSKNTRCLSLLGVKWETKMESKSLNIEVLGEPWGSRVSERVRVASGAQFWIFVEHLFISGAYVLWF